MISSAINLPEGFGRPAQLCIWGLDEERHFRVDKCAHSYDHAGGVLFWCSELKTKHACDVECLVGRRGNYWRLREKLAVESVEDLLRRWVVTEVLAKIYNTSILRQMKQYGLAPLLDYEQPHVLGDVEVFLVKCWNRILAFGRVL